MDDSATLTAAERADAAQALRAARARGLASLTAAVAWCAQHPVAILVPAAVAEFHQAKRCEGVREATVRSYRHQLGAFTAAHAARPLAALTPGDIAAHLLARANVTTRANRWQALATFFAWAAHRGYVGRNPVFQAMRKPLRPRPDRCIFTPAETAGLLARTKHTAALGYWVLALFAGLRTQEIHWLHEHPDPWSLIRPGTGVIDLRDQPPKTAPRVVPVTPALGAWLRWMRKHSLPFIGPNHWPRRRELQSAVLAPRPAGRFQFHNMPRRSYISYRLALPGASYAAIARDVGNSEGVLRKFYARSALRADAERYFALAPSRV